MAAASCECRKLKIHYHTIAVPGMCQAAPVVRVPIICVNLFATKLGAESSGEQRGSVTTRAEQIIVQF